MTKIIVLTAQSATIFMVLGVVVRSLVTLA